MIQIKKNVQEKSKETKKSSDRLEVLEKIAVLEKEGKFDVDVENDPPTIPLMPENVDYLQNRILSRLKVSVKSPALFFRVIFGKL